MKTQQVYIHKQCSAVWMVLSFLDAGTVEPRFNEVAGDRLNLFVKSRVRYIENLDITNLRGNDQKVRYIEVIVNDWFVTQVTSVTQFNAIFVTPKCRVLRCNSFIKHGDFQCQLISLLSRRSAFLYGTKKRHFQSSDLKMLQHRVISMKGIIMKCGLEINWRNDPHTCWTI